MAFIDNQDENLDPNQQGQGQGQSPLVGQGSDVVSGGGMSPSSASGVGPGGTGGWTNIQAYLDANKGDTGSAQAVNKTVGDQFGQERNTFETDSSKFVNDAQSKADTDKITNDQVNDYVSQASGMYDYGGNQSDPYKAITSKLQNSLTGQYTGPKDYNYGFSNKTQEYGNDLTDNSGWDSLLKNVYSSSANAPLSSGQYQLQKQFDVNNQALADTRKGLTDQYGQLTNDRDKTVTDTTNKLSGIEQGYRDNQRNLKDYLSGQSNTYDTAERQAEADAKAAYKKDYSEGKSGQKSIAMDIISGRPSDKQDAMANRFRNPGIWSDNLTWDQLQRENDLVTINNYSKDNQGGVSFFDNDGSLQPVMNSRANMLKNWYGTEDQKYANTADKEKRSYNAIQDFLNSGAVKMGQQFKVRG